MIVPSYIMAKGLTVWGFQKKCSKLIADGWKPQGGVIRSWGFFYQAFIK